MRTPKERYSTVTEAAALLRCRRETVLRQIAKHGVPVLKLGRRLRFKLEDLERALAEREGA